MCIRDRNEILHNIPPTPQQEEFIEKLNLLLAGGDQIDAWWGNWSDYAKDGIIDVYKRQVPGIFSNSRNRVRPKTLKLIRYKTFQTFFAIFRVLAVGRLYG